MQQLFETMLAKRSLSLAHSSCCRRWHDEMRALFSAADSGWPQGCDNDPAARWGRVYSVVLSRRPNVACHLLTLQERLVCRARETPVKALREQPTL